MSPRDCQWTLLQCQIWFSKSLHIDFRSIELIVASRIGAWDLPSTKRKPPPQPVAIVLSGPMSSHSLFLPTLPETMKAWLPTHIYVTRPQWVSTWVHGDEYQDNMTGSPVSRVRVLHQAINRNVSIMVSICKSGPTNLTTSWVIGCNL